MGYYCKGYCKDFKGKRTPNGSRYESGQKRCSLCCIFLAVSSPHCPCCGVRLRTKSRNRKSN